MKSGISFFSRAVHTFDRHVENFEDGDNYIEYIGSVLPSRLNKDLRKFCYYQQFSCRNAKDGLQYYFYLPGYFREIVPSTILDNLVKGQYFFLVSIRLETMAMPVFELQSDFTLWIMLCQTMGSRWRRQHPNSRYITPEDFDKNMDD